MIDCKECGVNCPSEEFLRRHVKKHKMTSQEYTLKWVHDGKVPLCKCGCSQETSWNVALKAYAEFVLGHHAWGRKKSEEEKRAIGDANSVNMTRYMAKHPEYARKKVDAMNASQTDETERKRIEATKNAYANMSAEDKQKFSDHAKELWTRDDGNLMKEARLKAAETFKERSLAGEYDFISRNEKISESVTRRYLEGGFKWKRIPHQSAKMGTLINYRSTWEPLFAQLLDTDDNVAEWFYEPFRIPYVFGKKRKNYIPDFLVVFADGNKLLVEVKPITLRETGKNAAKREAAIEYCRENELTYNEWSPETKQGE